MSTRRRGGTGSSPDAERKGGSSDVVVGIGASAGGLEAFSRLLAGLPTDTGMAFVLVQHLDPKHPSLLTHLLSSKTAMPVSEATEGVEITADHVYVVPPHADILIERGRLRLRLRDADVQPHLAIDTFLRSLAEDKGERAIGVVLSGAASDGAQGLAAIKSAGGVTFAQEPSSADYPSMPLSAIGARVVDFVLPPEEIALELARLGKESHFGAAGAPRLPESEGDGETASFDEVFALLRGAFGVDFSAYKLPTIRRRIARRMLVRRSDDLEAYVGLLRDDPHEVETLYRDILIMVTEFFREPETFAALRDRVFPAILEERTADAGVRIWVPGCASGEETYSLAITLLEVMDALHVEAPVKIFATDISEPDLASARRGLYGQNISSAVPPDLLARYFARTEDGYQISKPIRELCVFARHDVTSDPPFPDLDLVSCRNLLIYLGTDLQRWVIPSLHYGLRPDGYLVLGRSESIGGFTELFETVDKKQKIFRKLSPVSAVGLFGFRAPQLDQPTRMRVRLPAEAGAPAALGPSAMREADEAVLAEFAPPGVTIDAQRTIVEFRGDTGPYLKIPAGRPSLNLLDMVRDGLRSKVRAVVAEAERTGARAAFRQVAWGKGKARRTIDLHAIPLTTRAGEARFVVLFDETAVATGANVTGSPGQVVEMSEADSSRDELNQMRERLEAVIQDKEAINEELRVANEEMLSSGEEMQSINEELETTQEELQSTNQELRSRNLDLGQVSDDLSNLLTSVSFPIIMVDRELRIRRFTPAAERLFKVITSDVGRFITDLHLRIDVPDLERILREVIDAMTPTERDVQDEEGHWYALEVRPYKTLDNRIDGAVITLFDIDERELLRAARRAAEAAVRVSETRLQIATEAAALGVHDYDVAAGTIRWDARVREIWGVGSEEQITYDTFFGGVHPEDREATQAAVDAAIDPAGSGRYQATFRVQNAADGTLRWVAATGQALFEGDSTVRLVGTVEDITERHRLEQALLKTELAAAGQEERSRLARELHDTATQALFAASLKAEALAQSEDPLPAWIDKAIEELRRLSRGALAQMRLLLLELHDEPLEQIPITQLLRQLVEATEGRVGTACELTIRGGAALSPQLHVTVYRIVQEALNNVSRHAKASRAWVFLELQPSHVHLSVEDDGLGFDPDTVDRSHLGLRSMQERADEAEAAFNVSARSGGGTVVTMDWNEEQKRVERPSGGERGHDE